MKKIQYKFGMEYTNQETLQVFGSLLKVVVVDLQERKKSKKKYSPKDFALYPLNTRKIAKLRKVLLVSSTTKGTKILDEIDLEFMSEVAKQNLKVIREETIN